MHFHLFSLWMNILIDYKRQLNQRIAEQYSPVVLFILKLILAER